MSSLDKSFDDIFSLNVRLDYRSKFRLQVGNDDQRLQERRFAVPVGWVTEGTY